MKEKMVSTKQIWDLLIKVRDSEYIDVDDMASLLDIFENELFEAYVSRDISNEVERKSEEEDNYHFREFCSDLIYYLMWFGY